VIAALTSSQDKIPSMINNHLEQEEEGETTNLYSYTFDVKAEND
jgi:hypothetical protein